MSSEIKKAIRLIRELRDHLRATGDETFTERIGEALYPLKKLDMYRESAEKEIPHCDISIDGKRTLDMSHKELRYHLHRAMLSASQQVK